MRKINDRHRLAAAFTALAAPASLEPISVGSALATDVCRECRAKNQQSCCSFTLPRDHSFIVGNWPTASTTGRAAWVSGGIRRQPLSSRLWGDALLDVARTRNEEFSPPLSDDEVIKVATSAWGYTKRGENRFGIRPTI